MTDATRARIFDVLHAYPSVPWTHMASSHHTNVRKCTNNYDHADKMVCMLILLVALNGEPTCNDIVDVSF